MAIYCENMVFLERLKSLFVSPKYIEQFVYKVLSLVNAYSYILIMRQLEIYIFSRLHDYIHWYKNTLMHVLNAQVYSFPKQMLAQ